MAKPFRRLFEAMVVGGAMALVGCERGNRRVETLTVGIGKDSALALMGGQATVVGPYLVNSQYIETFLFPIDGKTDSVSLMPRNMTPIVVVDEKLVGWGWVYWDSVAAANRIEVPKAGNRE